MSRECAPGREEASKRRSRRRFSASETAVDSTMDCQLNEQSSILDTGDAQHDPLHIENLHTDPQLASDHFALEPGCREDEDYGAEEEDVEQFEVLDLSKAILTHQLLFVMMLR